MESFPIVKLHFLPTHSRKALVACLPGTSTFCFPPSASYPDAGSTRPLWSLLSGLFPHWAAHRLLPMSLFTVPFSSSARGAQYPACIWALSPSALCLLGLMTSDIVFRLRDV